VKTSDVASLTPLKPAMTKKVTSEEKAAAITKREEQRLAKKMEREKERIAEEERAKALKLAAEKEKEKEREKEKEKEAAILAAKLEAEKSAANPGKRQMVFAINPSDIAPEDRSTFAQQQQQLKEVEQTKIPVLSTKTRAMASAVSVEGADDYLPTQPQQKATEATISTLSLTLSPQQLKKHVVAQPVAVMTTPAVSSEMQPSALPAKIVGEHSEPIAAARSGINTIATTATSTDLVSKRAHSIAKGCCDSLQAILEEETSFASSALVECAVTVERTQLENFLSEATLLLATNAKLQRQLLNNETAVAPPVLYPMFLARVKSFAERHQAILHSHETILNLIQTSMA
jgi:hypothetical protein